MKICFSIENSFNYDKKPTFVLKNACCLISSSPTPPNEQSKTANMLAN